MSSPPTPPVLSDIPAWEKIGIGTAIFAYAVGLGAAYLFAFWRPIGFDIFPYLSLQNYISLALNRVVALVLFPAIAATAFFSNSFASPHSSLRKVSLYLVGTYSIGALSQQYEAIELYINHPFYYRNEVTALLISISLLIASIAISYRTYKHITDSNQKVISVIFVQASIVIAAGYCDGKAIHNGADNVFFLGNKDLCEENGERDWVYLGKFSDSTFLMNTIDKRICITGAKDIKFISRKIKENL